MRFERSRWFHCLFRAGLVAGWPRPLRAVAHLAMLAADTGFFMLFASQVRAAPVYAPAVAFFFLRTLYSLRIAVGGAFLLLLSLFGAGDGDDAVAVLAAIQPVAEDRDH